VRSNGVSSRFGFVSAKLRPLRNAASSARMMVGLNLLVRLAHVGSSASQGAAPVDHSSRPPGPRIGHPPQLADQRADPAPLDQPVAAARIPQPASLTRRRPSNSKTTS
jgi:hypothetical protein